MVVPSLAWLARLAGGLLIVAAVLLGDLPLLTSAWKALRAKPVVDAVSDVEARMAPLRAATPPTSVGVRYGFIGDGDALAKYYQTEYTLAPRVVVRGTDPELIIGLFDKPYAATIASKRLRVVRDFGRGVLLLEKAP